MGNLIGRRPLLGGAIATAAAVAGTSGLLHTAGAAALGKRPTEALDTHAAKDIALIFRKLAYSADPTPGYWHLTATRYGLVGSELIPFWEMHIGRFFTVQDLPGGDYAVNQMGVAFYTDLDTGAYLRKFTNPITKQVVDIPYGRAKPNRYAPPQVRRPEYEPLGALVSRSPNAESPTDKLIPTGALGPAWIQGEDVWVQQDHLLTLPPAQGSATGTRINDLTTYFGALREVADPSIKMPRAGHAFTDINDWPPWLGMGSAQPGVYYSRGIGYKAFSYAEMPETWRRLFEQEYPEIARDPIKALQG
jgi:hypothetical protein